jgi:hypothetical protein
MTRLLAGILFVALYLGCGGEETKTEPARAPDAGHRFVDQPDPQEPDAPRERAERREAEPTPDPVDAAGHQRVPQAQLAPPAGIE